MTQQVTLGVHSGYSPYRKVSLWWWWWVVGGWCLFVVSVLGSFTRDHVDSKLTLTCAYCMHAITRTREDLSHPHVVHSEPSLIRAGRHRSATLAIRSVPPYLRIRWPCLTNSP